jgi:hypothetical protein|tara:strand:+ start:288 stop:803 length:516 start_codon:yes stop_codon:yes gene_type:complete
LLLLGICRKQLLNSSIQQLHLTVDVVGAGKGRSFTSIPNMLQRRQKPILRGTGRRAACLRPLLLPASLRGLALTLLLRFLSFLLRPLLLLASLRGLALTPEEAIDIGPCPTGQRPRTYRRCAILLLRLLFSPASLRGLLLILLLRPLLLLASLRGLALTLLLRLLLLKLVA